MKIFSKNKRSEEKGEIMTSLYLNSMKQRIFEKNLYERREERKEKYKMTNTIVYALNDLRYLIV